MSAPGGRTGPWLVAVAGVVVAGTVIAALVVMDSPSRQRAERLDRIRVDYLQLLSQRIDAHANVHDALPGTLAILDGTSGQSIADPVTGQPFPYEVTGERSYRLCATFDTAVGAPRTGMPAADEWRHGDGRQCFDREIRKLARPGAPVAEVR
ncbi:MAG TPA: hypothetical protein VFM73_06065 [Xanthomonadaceae bacterium]|nr:hypothetical protein [Xanthomonadaceae bacterium]